MIDWTKPIELHTDPPRPAFAKAVFDGGASVKADWDGDGIDWLLSCDNSGEVCGMPERPRVRNVAGLADDIAAELAEALRTARDYVADTASGALAFVDSGEGLAAMATEDVKHIDATLAKWEARK